MYTCMCILSSLSLVLLLLNSNVHFQTYADSELSLSVCGGVGGAVGGGGRDNHSVTLA